VRCFYGNRIGYAGAVTGRKRDIDDLQAEIQELFADLWQVPRFSGMRYGFRPQYDCYRTDDPPTLHVVVELAGVDPGSVEVVASGNTLVISGTRERPHTPAARYLAMEIDYGPFQRRVELGDEIDPARTTATYDRGLLKVTLPVAERPPPAGTVPIEVQRRA
jgi:HSP20 family molecular chaperone IbpA